MIDVVGKYAHIKIMTDRQNVEQAALEQVGELTNLPNLNKAKIVMMPDIHKGYGCTIGTTMKFDKLQDMKITPEWVGNDIGCGVTVLKLGSVEEIELDFDALDKLTKEITVGMDREATKKMVETDGEFSKLYGKDIEKKVIEELGRVSGGNHFLEIGEMNGDYYLSVHNGSLFLGQHVYKKYTEKMKHSAVDRNPIISELKKQKKTHMIQPILEKIGELEEQHKKEHDYLSRKDLVDYIREVTGCKVYALLNRLAVAHRVFEALGIEKNFEDFLNHPKEEEYYNSTHNYIDINTLTLYKGACPAQKGEDVIIPINMRDGIIIAKGKGNKEWNESAPHGAGRLMSRTKAKQNIDLETYKEQLKGVRSVSINEHTLDEAPDAYKSIDYILDKIEPTADVVGIIKPVYNFKVAEERKW